MKVKVKVGKNILMMGVGAATGTAVPILLRKYVDASYTLPMKVSTLVPLITGGVGLVLGLFTNVIKKDTLRNFIVGYSFPALISAVIDIATGDAGIVLTSESLSSSSVAMPKIQPRRSLNGNASNRYINISNPYSVTSKVAGYEGTGLGRSTSDVIVS